MQEPGTYFFQLVFAKEFIDLYSQFNTTTNFNRKFIDFHMKLYLTA